METWVDPGKWLLWQCAQCSNEEKKNQKYLIPRIKPTLHPGSLDSKLYREIDRDNFKNYRFAIALYKDTELCTANLGFRFNAMLNSCIDSLYQWEPLRTWLWHSPKAISCGWLFVCCLPVVSCTLCLPHHCDFRVRTASREKSVHSFQPL